MQVPPWLSLPKSAGIGFCRPHVLGHGVESRRGVVPVLPGRIKGHCLIQPSTGLDIVLRHALAFGVHRGEFVKCDGIAFIGRLRMPCRRERTVLCHAIGEEVYTDGFWAVR